MLAGTYNLRTCGLWLTAVVVCGNLDDKMLKGSSSPGSDVETVSLSSISALRR